jgi:adenylosuccinate synthase
LRTSPASCRASYKYDDEVLTDFPEEERIWREAEPAYEELSGW